MSEWEREGILDGIKFLRRWKGREAEGSNTPVAALTINQRDTSSGVSAWRMERVGARQEGGSSYWVAYKNIQSPIVYSGTELLSLTQALSPLPLFSTRQQDLESLCQRCVSWWGLAVPSSWSVFFPCGWVLASADLWLGPWRGSWQVKAALRLLD